MRIASKIYGYDFSHDFLPLMMTEYDFKILKKDQQTIEVIARNTTMNEEENAQITIEMDADLCIDITIYNTDNNKKLVYS